MLSKRDARLLDAGWRRSRIRGAVSGLFPAVAALAAAPAFAEDEPAVRLGASYVADTLAVIDGGRERGGAWLGRGDVTVTVDGGAVGLPGVRLFADVLATQPGDFSGRYVGDFQTVSNVQADSAIRPFELWADAQLAPRLGARAGLIDLNGTFDIQEVGAIFLNSSHGIGPDFSQSGANGPSIFPAAATAVILRYDARSWRARLGLFDAVAGSLRNPRRTAFRLPGRRGALIVGEIERALGKAELQLGAWRYTTRFAAIDPAAPRASSQGAYAQIEGAVATDTDAWLRIGIADDRANPIGAYIGGGVARGSERSRLGIAIAHARFGGSARRFLFDRRARAAETAIEMTWSRRLIDGVSIQPDVQYVVHPGGDPQLRNALVVGGRLRVHLEQGLFAGR